MDTKYSQNLSTLYKLAKKCLSSKTVKDWDVFVDALTESSDIEDLTELITVLMSEQIK